MLRSTQGRGYPDVSLLSMDFQIIVGGDFVSVFGTSGSAPGTNISYSTSMMISE